jgi:hypothetical protein
MMVSNHDAILINAAIIDMSVLHLLGGRRKRLMVGSLSPDRPRATKGGVR